MKINVVTVLKSGPNWIPEYVVKLKKAVDNFLIAEHDFYCISDVEIPDVNVLPMIPIEAWGVWAKPQLFRKDLNLVENCLYIDLDTIICGNLDIIIDDIREYKFLMSSDPWKGDISCSALMWWNGDYSYIWEEFCKQPISHWHGQYQSIEKYVDQGFISDRVEHQLIQHKLKNPDRIARITKRTLQENHNHSILFCSGKRKPWNNLEHPDVKKYWNI